MWWTTETMLTDSLTSHSTSLQLTLSHDGCVNPLTAKNKHCSAHVSDGPVRLSSCHYESVHSSARSCFCFEASVAGLGLERSSGERQMQTENANVASLQLKADPSAAAGVCCRREARH